MIITRMEVAATSIKKLVLREESCRIAYRPESADDLYHLCLRLYVGKGRHNNCIVGNGHQNYKINVGMYSGNKMTKVRTFADCSMLNKYDTHTQSLYDSTGEGYIIIMS